MASITDPNGEKKIIDNYDDMDGDELNFIEEYDDVDLKTRQLGIILQCTNDKTENNMDDVQQKKRRIEDLIKDKFPVAEGKTFSTSLDENIKQVSDYVLSILDKDKNEGVKKKSRKRKANSPARALTCVKQSIRPKTMTKSATTSLSTNADKNKVFSNKSKIAPSQDTNSLKMKEIRPFVPISIAPQRALNAQVITNGTNVFKPVFRYRLPVGQTLMLRPNNTISPKNDNSQIRLFKQASHVTAPSFLLQPNNVTFKSNDITPTSSMMLYLKDKNNDDYSFHNTQSLRFVNGQPDFSAVQKKFDNSLGYKANSINHIQQAKPTIILMDSNKTINLPSVAKPNLNSIIISNTNIINPKKKKVPTATLR